MSDLDDLAADVDGAEPEPARTTTVTGGRPPHLQARADMDTDGVTVSDVPSDVELSGDLSPILEFFGLDPSVFAIVDDTVKVGKWQQSKGYDDGRRDIVWLWSYSARFRRTAERLPAADVDALRQRVGAWNPLIRRTPGAGLGEPCTQYVGWSDWQLGKAGSAITTQRVLDSFERTQQRIEDSRKVGRNVQALAIANMGDPLESCYGHYESQTFTVEMTQRQQLNHVLDLWSTGLRALAPMFEDVTFASVLSNHGEWTRGGGSKPITSDSDSADAFLAETLRRVFTDRPDYGHVKWVIPHDEMTVTGDFSGVRTAMNHGHKAPGSAKELEWLRGQSLRLLRQDGVEPRLWMTAHRHHVDVKDYGPWWRMQHPTLDTGSKWFEDTSGFWSTPGTLTCLIGQHAAAGGLLRDGGKGWSDLAVL